MRHPRAFLAPLPAALLLAAALGGGRTLAADDDCMMCHADASLTMSKGGKTVSIGVAATVLARSPHKNLSCTDCHTGFDAANVPHKAKIEPVACLGCHADPSAAHAFHASMQAPDGEALKRAPASCKDCHGTHDITRIETVVDGRPEKPGSACERCHDDVVLDYRASNHGRVAAEGVPSAPTCKSCHDKPITAERMPGDPAARKIAQEKLCISCHLEDTSVRKAMGPSAGFITAYDGSVHGAALHAGNGAAANCVDCHGAHSMLHGSDPKAKVSRANLADTCSKCHAKVASAYAESVHGAALAKGVSKAPVCTDCHGEHSVYKHNDPRSPVAARNLSARVCSPCHSSVALSEKYGLPSERPASYATSYHGLAIRGGSVEAANCASCHGSHDILPSSDPRSTIHRSRLPETCGKCHPGANERFAVGKLHVVAESGSEPILYWISFFYIGMIIGTVGGMLAHNTLDFVTKSRHLMRVRRGEIVEELAGRGLYLRMTVAERLQHVSLMVSFGLLVLTGFMLRYPDAWWVSWIREVWAGAFDLRSYLHRIAGVVMIAASLLHIVYVSATARGRTLIRDLFPGRQDAYDAIGMIKFYLGVAPRKPQFGRFGYIEKAEYWALVWGTIVMAATGILMWFENTSMGILTKLGWDIARTVHFYEAWLATLAILVWHIYFVIFNPDAYPMNMAWLTGHLTEREMEEEHPLELETIHRREIDLEAAGGETMVAEVSKEPDPADGTSSRPGPGEADTSA